MKWNKKVGLSILTLVLVIALSSDVLAQRRRYDRGGYRNNYAYNYRPSRPYVFCKYRKAV